MKGCVITAENKNSKARIAANNKYNAKAYDRINIAVPKGKKDLIKSHADKYSESINAFINRAIDKAIADDDKQAAPDQQEPTAAEPKAKKAEGETSDCIGQITGGWI